MAFALLLTRMTRTVSRADSVDYTDFAALGEPQGTWITRKEQVGTHMWRRGARWVLAALIGLELDNVLRDRDIHVDTIDGIVDLRARSVLWPDFDEGDFT